MPVERATLTLVSFAASRLLGSAATSNQQAAPPPVSQRDSSRSGWALKAFNRHSVTVTVLLASLDPL